MTIEEAGLDDLIIEIMKRHHACVVVGLQKNYDAPNSTCTTLRFTGYPEICVGLCQKASYIMLNTELMQSSLKTEFKSNKDIDNENSPN